MEVYPNTTSEEIIFSFRPHHLAGLIVFTVSLFGMVFNYLVVGLIRKVSSLQNAFGRLTMSQALGECVHLTIFALYFAPTVFFDITYFKSENVSRFFGQVTLMCYDVCIYSHLVISVNRLTAIFFPFAYNQIFTSRNTKIMVYIVWTLAILPSFYLYNYLDCRLIYTDMYWNFAFTTAPVCGIVGWFADFLKYVSIVSIIAILDIITFTKVRLNSSKVVTHAYADAAQLKRRHDEINFVKQVCLQGVVFVCELLCYFIFSQFVEHKWAKFMLTTFAWQMVHSLDGLITLTFNKGFGRIIRGTFNITIKTGSSHSHRGDYETSKTKH